MATLLVTASNSSCLTPTAAAPRDCVCSLVEGKVSFGRTGRQRAVRGEQTCSSRGSGMPLVTSSPLQSQNEGSQPASWQGNFGRPLLSAAAAAALSLSISLCGVDFALARPEGVNRPELLPKSFSTVIDVAGFLSPQQEGRIAQDLAIIEEETGFKLRVLAQNYPETPGLAVKNFWQVDDNTIVFVADPNMGVLVANRLLNSNRLLNGRFGYLLVGDMEANIRNILNFNVGSSVDLNVPRSFWSRLAGKYGNIFFWREKGEDASIEAAVAAIGQCLREPAGPYACSEIK